MAIVMCVGFAACGGGGGDDDGPGTPGGGGTTPPPSGITSETVSSGSVTSVSVTVYCKVTPATDVNPFQVGAVISDKAAVSASDYKYLGNPTSLTGTEYSLTFTGLKPNTTYYYRSFYYNGKTYVYGAVKSVKTAASKVAFVNLDLPSGTLWATTNVGADKPEDYGCYFVWSSPVPMGNVKSKAFDVDEVGDIIPADIMKLDPAYEYFGEGWHSPNKAQMTELCSKANCEWKWYDGTTKLYKNTNVAGYEVVSKANGKSIFLPAAGYYNGVNVVNAGKNGYYWSRRGKADVDTPVILSINATTHTTLGMSKENALTVRPVRDAE